MFLFARSRESWNVAHESESFILMETDVNVIWCKIFENFVEMNNDVAFTASL